MLLIHPDHIYYYPQPHPYTHCSYGQRMLAPHAVQHLAIGHKMPIMPSILRASLVLPSTRLLPLHRAHIDLHLLLRVSLRHPAPYFQWLILRGEDVRDIIRGGQDRITDGNHFETLAIEG